MMAAAALTAGQWGEVGGTADAVEAAWRRGCGGCRGGGAVAGA
jgi:hypothetical protein